MNLIKIAFIKNENNDDIKYIIKNDFDIFIIDVNFNNNDILNYNKYKYYKNNYLYLKKNIINKKYINENYKDSLIFEFKKDNNNYLLINTFFNKYLYFLNKKELEDIKKLINKYKGNIILLGDLNLKLKNNNFLDKFINETKMIDAVTSELASSIFNCDFEKPKNHILYSSNLELCDIEKMGKNKDDFYSMKLVLKNN